jgi:homoserine O-succinyltransferase
MPDGAMRATELQFAKLLKDAAAVLGPRALDVRLHLFSLSDIPRGDLARSRMEGFYAEASPLPGAGMDGLIVTGAEPGAGDLRDEPYWPALSHLVDWAEIGTVSTYFSCLAAHAAVLHLDNIPRRKLPQKLSGVFAAERGETDPITTGMAGHAQVPHSRLNEVPESALEAKGYRILSRLADGGADLFSRKSYSLFVFAQGHPEYDGATLGREYLRDLARAIQGRSEPPAVPQNYFDRMTENRLRDMMDDGVIDLERYQAVVHGAVPFVSWRGHTVRLFANWLAGIAAEKARRAAPRPASARKRA